MREQEAIDQPKQQKNALGYPATLAQRQRAEHRQQEYRQQHVFAMKVLAFRRGRAAWP